MSNLNRRSIYATVVEEEGINYREIAEMMSEIGFRMNHSSARNYVLRTMRKFADAIDCEWNLCLTETKKDQLAKSPQFQQAISDILQMLT